MRRQFFLDSSKPLYFVHYKLPQGATVQQTSADLQIVEDWLADREIITATTAFAKEGAARLMLTYNAGDANPSSGNIIVRVAALDLMEEEIQAPEDLSARAPLQGQMRSKRLASGASGKAPIEARFYGADPTVLRDLANEARERLAGASDNILFPRIDWGGKELVLKADYAAGRAREAGVSRSDTAQLNILLFKGILHTAVIWLFVPCR
ncbi:MAG: hypothetical protein AAFQ36_03205 [Pseudomonadota bacterium]